MSFTNWNFSPRGSGSSLIQQSPNCPWPPVCFLWRPCTLARAANGFAVRNFRRFQFDLHSVAALQTADDDLEMLLPVARQQKLLCLRIAIEAQREIFFENLGQGGAQAVFVVARLGGHGVGDGWFGKFDAADKRRSSLSRTACRR